MKQYNVAIVDTVNAIQNNQYMRMLDRKTGVTRDKWMDFGVDIYCFLDDLKARGIEIILVLGYEGSGKSYGIKTLNPETTKWFHADNKPPTFKGGLSGYFENRDLTKPKPNYQVPKTYSDIITWIDKGREKGVIASNLKVFILGHIEDFKTADGEMRQRLKVLGNMATKMNIEGSVTHCYYTEITKMGDKLEFKLRTQNSGFNTGRSPDEMFNDTYIPNDFQLILDAIEKY